MKGIGNGINFHVYYYSFCIDHIKFSCYTDQVLSGTDYIGDQEDLVLFNECPECGLYDSIRCTEILKQTINAMFLKHVIIAGKTFMHNPRILNRLGFFKTCNNDLSTWIEHVKSFYSIIITDNNIYNKLEKSGMTVEVIENVLELLFQLEEYNIKNNQTSLDTLN